VVKYSVRANCVCLLMKGDTMKLIKKEKSTKSKRYTLGEEIFSSVAHGIGCLLSVAGLVVLVVFSALRSDAWSVVSSAIYGGSLVVLYCMSTLYHAITNETAKKFFRIMDHNTIFFLIAGTYTPITLDVLRRGNPVLGWVLFGIVWGAAVLGICLNSIDLEKYSKPSVVCYVAMGWVIVFAIKPMLAAMSALSLWFLLIGGIFYTVGIIFYAVKRVKYFHSIWHIFTIAGSVFQYFAILNHILSL